MEINTKLKEMFKYENTNKLVDKSTAVMVLIAIRYAGNFMCFILYAMCL